MSTSEYERKADERNRRRTRNFIITIATFIAIIIAILVWSSVKDGNTHWNRDEASNALCLSFVSGDIESKYCLHQQQHGSRNDSRPV
jgi:membrane protein involved in colicin uptake